MAKHPKTDRPSDRDLDENPMIGGSKGSTMAHALPDDIEDAEGETTIEGDVENDVNAAGGVDKAIARGGRSPVRP